MNGNGRATVLSLLKNGAKRDYDLWKEARFPSTNCRTVSIIKVETLHSVRVRGDEEPCRRFANRWNLRIAGDERVGGLAEYSEGNFDIRAANCRGCSRSHCHIGVSRSEARDIALFGKRLCGPVRSMV